LTNPTPRDVFLNPACGSGALLIERLRCAPAQQTIGCDISPEALVCARANIKASGHSRQIELQAWDARALPLPSRSIDAICSDLPFGNLVGSHEANVALYPSILQEAARVAKPGARFVIISHEVRLMEKVLGRSTGWVAENVLPITLGGLHPRVFVLRKT
jgi:tRNA (guanine6-N2)-methyltransferase